MKKFQSIPISGFSKTISTFLLFVYLIYLAGCSYYNVSNMDPITGKSIIKQVIKKDKYIIVHFESKAWHLNNITIDNGAQLMIGTLETLPENHMYYKTAKLKNAANRYRNNGLKKTDRPIHEIHLYLNENPGDQLTAKKIRFKKSKKLKCMIHTLAQQYL